MLLTVVLISDQTEVIAKVREYLGQEFKLLITDFSGYIEMLTVTNPNLIIIDDTGVRDIRSDIITIKTEWPSTRIISIINWPEEDFRGLKMLEAGAFSFVYTDETISTGYRGLKITAHLAIACAKTE